MPIEPNAGPIFFEFRDVCKSFDERPVLIDVSFTVQRGETCVIMGRSGVGKSVSLKHIMGFLKADSGRVYIDGEDVSDFTEKQFETIRRKVTMVFQSGALFDSLTVAENIAFPMDRQPGLTAEDVEAYIQKFAKMLEVEEVLDRLPSELSTGMKRAVSIARTLAAKPRRDSLRRAHHHGGSHHGWAYGRPDFATEGNFSQNFHRRHPRHAPGPSPRRHCGFSSGRPSSGIFFLG